MEYLKETIGDYLKRQTNYAILITGKWGAGKTFFYKNNLSTWIQEISIISDHQKKYKSIHISLFGLTTIDEIQTQIFLSIYPMLKNSNVKIPLGIFKSISRGVFSVFRLGNIDDHIKDFVPDVDDITDLKQLVICFDDIERASIEMEVLIGYINTLVENNDTKIIIIANENKIKGKKYNKLKEKVIGITLEFLPEFKNSLENIIQEKYKREFGAYYLFISSHYDLITKMEPNFDSNLRTLIYSLDTFHNIFSSIVCQFPNIEETIFEGKMGNILKFTLAICIEYKNNMISFNERKELDVDNRPSLEEFSAMIGPEMRGKVLDSEPEKSYKDSFYKKYNFRRSEFKFHESIYNYVTGLKSFDPISLESEIKEAYHYDGNSVLQQYEILNQLSYQNCYFLSNKDYSQMTRKMINYAKNGDYKIGDYITVFDYALRFDNILNLSKESLKEKIKQGISKGKSRFSYVPHLNFYLNIPPNYVYNKELDEISKFALKINEELKIEKEESEAKDILLKLKSDPEKFKQTLRDSDSKWQFTPLFKYASSYLVYNHLNNSTPSLIIDFADILRNRYKRQHDDLDQELNFLSGLKQRVSNKIKSNRKSLKNHSFKVLFYQTESAIKSLESFG